jgi:NADP-dependent 3-hydroxy acid dehydrogenase YdfG
MKKVIVVTGASSGFGALAARALADQLLAFRKNFISYLVFFR